ncbi:MAG: hypothetical protein V3V78_04990 [Candidatus Woesearchaeota archaeon]
MYRFLKDMFFRKETYKEIDYLEDKYKEFYIDIADTLELKLVALKIFKKADKVIGIYLQCASEITALPIMYFSDNFYKLPGIIVGIESLRLGIYLTNRVFRKSLRNDLALRQKEADAEFESVVNAEFKRLEFKQKKKKL